MANLFPRLALYLSAVSIVGWAPAIHAGMPHPETATSASTSSPQLQSENLPAQPGNASSTRKKVLDPNKMFGQAKLAYAAAEKIPDTIEHLFCYCGCDLPDADRHTSLLDCYTCEHGMECDICTGEVLLALRLKTEGKSLKEIQRAVDAKFSMERDPSFPMTDALRKYRASLGLNTDASPAGISQKSKSKPGAKDPNCCGHGNKKKD